MSPNDIPKEIPKPSLRVYLIRHGEVEFAHENRLNGHKDVALSERGEEQMTRVAEALGQKPIKAVYSSDLYRSRRGAEQVAARLGLEVKLEPKLREIDFGDVEGLGWREAMVAMGGPEKMLNWVENRFPGGENLIDFRDRALPLFREIVAREKGEIALFAHGGTNRLILYEELGIGLRNFFMFEQSFGCVNILDYYGGIMKVLRLLNGGPECLKNFEPV